MKKLFITVAISLVLASCATLKGRKVQVCGEQKLTVKMVAKRGGSSLVMFKEIPGTFKVRHCEWVKDQVVTVNFRNDNAVVQN